VLRHPGPPGERASDLAAQLGMTKQALNYQLGQLETRYAQLRGLLIELNRVIA
jgi:hypothetical protein